MYQALVKLFATQNREQKNDTVPVFMELIFQQQRQNKQVNTKYVRYFRSYREKRKQDKADRKCWEQCGGDAILNRVAREDLFDKMHLIIDLKGIQKQTVRHLWVEYSKPKKQQVQRPKAGMCLVCSRNSTEVSVNQRRVSDERKVGDEVREV